MEYDNTEILTEIKKDLNRLFAILQSQKKKNLDSDFPIQNHNMYALYGGWGTGKTTILQGLKEVISKGEMGSCEVIVIRPWEFEDKEVSFEEYLIREIEKINPHNLIGKIIKKTPYYILISLIVSWIYFIWYHRLIIQQWVAETYFLLESLYGGLETLFKIILGTIISIPIVLLITRVMLVLKTSGWKINSFGIGGVTFLLSKQLHYIKRGRSEDSREAFAKALKRGFKDKKILVMIDDMDRCRPETNFQVLESVKHYFALDSIPIIFLFAIDRDALAGYVGSHYGEDREFGYRYLDKFFEDSFEIPKRHDLMVMERIYNKELEEFQKKSIFDYLYRNLNSHYELLNFLYLHLSQNNIRKDKQILKRFYKLLSKIDSEGVLNEINHDLLDPSVAVVSSAQRRIAEKSIPLLRYCMILEYLPEIKEKSKVWWNDLPYKESNTPKVSSERSSSLQRELQDKLNNINQELEHPFIEGFNSQCDDVVSTRGSNLILHSLYSESAWQFQQWERDLYHPANDSRQ